MRLARSYLRLYSCNLVECCVILFTVGLSESVAARVSPLLENSTSTETNMLQSAFTELLVKYAAITHAYSEELSMYMGGIFWKATVGATLRAPG